MNKVSITHINNSHGDWLRSLDFYKQELGVLKGRLTEVAGKNTGADVIVETLKLIKKIRGIQIDIEKLINNVIKNTHLTNNEKIQFIQLNKLQFTQRELELLRNDLKEKQTLRLLKYTSPAIIQLLAGIHNNASLDRGYVVSVVASDAEGQARLSREENMELVKIKLMVLQQIRVLLNSKSLLINYSEREPEKEKISQLQ